MAKIIIIASSWMGLTPDIQVFYTEHKALKYISSELVEEEFINEIGQPDPDGSFVDFASSYYQWIFDNHKVKERCLFDYLILK